MPSDRLNMKDWMRERWDEVEDAAGAAGRGFYGVRPREAAPAARPKAVRALGPVIETRDGIPVPKGPPIRRGPGQISDEEIANIIFNETRALSGPGIDEARRNIAHAVINGAEAGGKRPKSAPTRAEIPEVEREIYHSAVNAVAGARYERSKGLDPTDGGVHFDFRPNGSTGPWWRDHPLLTQKGPFKNSYPHGDLPNRDGVYANTYQDDD